MKHVVVIGAGITGLSLGHFLKRAGHRVTIVEASPRPGGVIYSELDNGYLLERGPNSILTKPPIEQLIADLKIESSVVIPHNTARDRFIAVRMPRETGRLKLISVPRSTIELLTSPLLTTGEKLRILKEPWSVKSLSDDVDVWSFFAGRCGSAFATEVISTMLSGIWAADTKKLSLRSALPQLWKVAEQGRSILTAGFSKEHDRDNRTIRHKSRIISCRGGLRDLIEALSSQFSADELRVHSTVERLSENTDGVRISLQDAEIDGDAVVVTTAANNTANLLAALDPQLALSLQTIPYAPLGIIHLAVPYSATSSVTGFGFLSSPSAQLITRGVIFNSALFQARAPKEMHLLTAFVGGGPAPDAADVTNEIVCNTAVDEIVSLLGLTARPIVLSQSYLPRAIPNYALGHHKIVGAVEQFSKQHPRIQVLGNWLRGISVPDRVEEASALALKLSKL